MTEPHPIAPLAAGFDAVVRVPGSKSITNRALVCAALADGRSVLEGALWADDTEGMVGCLRSLGVDIDVDASAERMVVVGCNGVPPATEARLDVLLSGTTARFVTPVASTGHGRFEIDGGPPMRRRPMGPLIDALRALGVTVEEGNEAGHLPFVLASDGVEGGRVALSGDVSSQFLSGVMLAAPSFAKGVEIELTTDLVSAPYVELTRSVMSAFGADASAASYFFAAAALCGGRVRIDDLGTNSGQGDLALLDVLSSMGASVERGPNSTTVAGTGTLRGVTVDLRDFSDMVPTLAVVAAFADSPTTITGIGFIRGKESDRIDAVVTELKRCGVEAVAEDDGMTIHPGTPHGAVVETYDDHRIAMAFAVLGLRVPGVQIADAGCVAKTFPGFFEALDQLRGSGPLS
jgi:3-phosphoshikimate 1-carboxyvinyltransferase